MAFCLLSYKSKKDWGFLPWEAQKASEVNDNIQLRVV